MTVKCFYPEFIKLSYLLSYLLTNIPSRGVVASYYRNQPDGSLDSYWNISSSGSVKLENLSSAIQAIFAIQVYVSNYGLKAGLSGPLSCLNQRNSQ